MEIRKNFRFVTGKFSCLPNSLSTSRLRIENFGHQVKKNGEFLEIDPGWRLEDDGAGKVIHE